MIIYIRQLLCILKPCHCWCLLLYLSYRCIKYIVNIMKCKHLPTGAWLRRWSAPWGATTSSTSSSSPPPWTTVVNIAKTHFSAGCWFYRYCPHFDSKDAFCISFFFHQHIPSLSTQSFPQILSLPSMAPPSPSLLSANTCLLFNVTKTILICSFIITTS